VYPDSISSRYRVERELGGGGMSTVYLAVDIKHGRRVAVKIMRSDLAPGFGAHRFTREIELTARLTHPNILPLLDSGEQDGHAFYVMPFIEGESLRDLLAREKQLTVAHALQIAREVADALAYAHSRGVVHRDIKPENILLSAGHAVVADFGIARATTAAVDGNMTQIGIAIGTPAYMSPEQSLGEEIDGRTDIYALGCVLFEMLAGEVPFRAATAVAALARKITGPAPDLASIREIPAQLDELIRRALARDVNDRIQSAEEMLEGLEAARAGGPAVVQVPEAPANAIAVLAFVSMSANDDDQYLGDGISEELMHALTRLGGLRIVARTSAFAFRKSNLDVSEIGRRLKVRRLVEGSVRRSGSRLRVNAKLIDAVSAFEIWSERFDRDIVDLFDIEDEISGAIAHSLKDLLLAENGQHLRTNIPAKAAPTTNLIAYDHYLKGRHFWSQRSEPALRQSAEELRSALEADPNFALAYAALADTLVTMGLYGMAAPSDVMPLAREAAEHALSLDGGLAEAITAQACVRAIHDWDWKAAEQDFARAIAANPQYPTAHQWYAMHCLVPLGRFTEARKALERAKDLDPLSLSITVSVAAVDYYERRYANAIESSREVIRLDPGFAMGYYFLGLALQQDGRADEAVQALDSAAVLSGTGEILAALASALASAGELERARAILAQLSDRAKEHYESPVLLAMIEVALGEPQRALAHLEEARAQRSADLMWLAVRPSFDPLRADPAFVKLLDVVTSPDALRSTHE
jgi:serine/threonine-protein kinase